MSLLSNKLIWTVTSRASSVGSFVLPIPSTHFTIPLAAIFPSSCLEAAPQRKQWAIACGVRLEEPAKPACTITRTAPR